MTYFRILIIFTLLLNTHSALYASEIQSLDAIQAKVINFIKANIDTQQDYEISSKSLDRQLALPKCSVPLEAYTNAQTIEAGIVSVGIRCLGKQKWSLYTSAKLTIYKNVLVLTHSLKRNSLIQPSDVTLTKRATNKLRHGYFSSYKQIKSQVTTRNLQEGTVLQLAHLSLPKLIKRGEKVTILALSPAFNIQMSGKALMDGRLGAQIRVRNTKTKKIIEGRVIKPGVIVVN